MLTLFLAALSNINGEQAVAAVRKTMNDFGYRQPSRLQKLSVYNRFDKPAEKFWSVELGAKGNLYVTAHVRADDGRVVGFNIPAQRRTYHPTPTANATFRKRADELANQLRGSQPIRFDSLDGNRQGIVFATYKILIGGHPFIGSYSHAGYAVSFDVDTKRLLSYGIYDRPPRIDPRPPRLTQPQAEAIVRKYVADRLTPQFQRAGSTVGAIKYLGGEFGYHLVNGEPTARRVWKVDFTAKISHPRRFFGGIQSVVVDAVTGEIVPYGGN